MPKINYLFLALSIATGILLADIVRWSVGAYAVNVALSEFSQSASEKVENKPVAPSNDAVDYEQFLKSQNMKPVEYWERKYRAQIKESNRLQAQLKTDRKKLATARKQAEQSCRFWQDQVELEDNERNREMMEKECSRERVLK